MFILMYLIMADDNLHPGPKSHKRYAEKIKDVLQDRFK